MKNRSTMNKKMQCILIACIILLSSYRSINAQEIRPLDVKIDFGEPVIEFTIEDIEIDGGIKTGELTDKGDGKYVVPVIVDEGEGILFVKVDDDVAHDKAGNLNIANEQNIKYDRLLPEPALELTNEALFRNATIRIDFGEKVEDFELSDVQITNGYAKRLEEVAEGQYELLISELNAGDEVSVSIPASVCKDVKENDNKPGILTFTYKETSAIARLRNNSTKSETVGEPDDQNIMKSDQRASYRFNAMTIYPNPSDGLFNIRYESEEVVENVTITVMDINGREILKDKFYVENQQFEKQYDISQFNKALYLIRMDAKNYTQTKRIIVQE